MKKFLTLLICKLSKNIFLYFSLHLSVIKEAFKLRAIPFAIPFATQVQILHLILQNNLQMRRVKNVYLLHFVAFFNVASLSPTGVDNEKVGVNNVKALELDNRIYFFSYFSLISIQKYHPKMQKKTVLLHSCKITPNILV